MRGYTIGLKRIRSDGLIGLVQRQSIERDKPIDTRITWTLIYIDIVYPEFLSAEQQALDIAFKDKNALLLAGPDERLELKHQAQSRSVFARGGLEAALWVARRKPGFYTMKEMLGL